LALGLPEAVMTDGERKWSEVSDEEANAYRHDPANESPSRPRR
jgi:hypothetical protein